MRILYVSTVVATMGFFRTHVKKLLDQGHSVEMACNAEGKEIFSLGEQECLIHQIDFSRSPTSRLNISAYRQLQSVIEKGDYDIIHTHTPIASSLVRLVCKVYPEIKVIYTAHGFHFYKGAPLKNWLLYYSVEKWLSRYTDILITINEEDYARAKAAFRADKVVYVPGVGVDIERFRQTKIDKQARKTELGLPEDAFILLSVGELSRRKNHEAIIRAMGELNDPNLHYLICGTGPLEAHLKELAENLKIGPYVHLLGYQANVALFYKLADLFVFPSYQEGLPVALMEAMASDVPVMASRIRGNTDLIGPAFDRYLFDPSDIGELKNKLAKVIQQKEHTPFIDSNRMRIDQFSDAKVLQQMEQIYTI